MVITLTDDTTGALLISRVYNAGAGGGGVDARFVELGDIFYTPRWQAEQLIIDSALSGHDFTLSVLAADCSPAGHFGYIYIDEFGSAAPDIDEVPEPGSGALVALGMACLLGSRLRSRQDERAATATGPSFAGLAGA